jgi:hypothetical protein
MNKTKEVILKLKIEFLKRQISLKDRRFDILLDSIQVKDAKINEMIDKIMKGDNHVDH